MIKIITNEFVTENAESNMYDKIAAILKKIKKNAAIGCLHEQTRVKLENLPSEPCASCCNSGVKSDSDGDGSGSSSREIGMCFSLIWPIG